MSTRYSVLFRFTKEEDIDTQKLADPWQGDRIGVVGMIGASKTSGKLYEDMRSLGFEDEEFPEWWYNPARDEQQVEEEQTSLDESLQEGKVVLSDEKEILAFVEQRRSVPISS